MIKLFTISLLFTILSAACPAQSLGKLLKGAVEKDSSAGKILDKTLAATREGNSTTLSNDDIVAGLKDALRVGTDSSSARLGKMDGFFGDMAVKILMPEEAKKVESSLRSMGMGSLVDKAILFMNRAAEDATLAVGDIFWQAIKNMTVSDGLKILNGGDFAATNYLKNTTTTSLTEKFRPVIEASLTKVNATKYWKDVFSKYNMFAAQKVNTDLTAYVTEKALSGLFYQISLQEQQIRKDPAAQVTSILKKVFGKQ